MVEDHVPDVVVEIVQCRCYHVATSSLRTHGGPVIQMTQHTGTDAQCQRRTLVDEDVAMTANGGTILVTPQPMPGIGRLAMCKDTEGNVFGLLQMEVGS